MKISREILYEILNCMPSIPPEAGGILGGKEGKISLWKYDKGCSEGGCTYSPNVNILNRVIAEWIEQGYDFMGILHVHFGGSAVLSDGDKRYIEKIMRAMPEYITNLYFPIVVQPDRRVVSYMACKDMPGNITILENETEVLD